MTETKEPSDQFSRVIKFDSRVTSHNLRLGCLSESEIKTHIGSLPDLSENVEYMRFDEMH